MAEVEFVYGSYATTVKMSSCNGGLIDSLDDKDVQVLQQCIFLALNTFVYVRGIYLPERKVANELEGQNEGMGRRRH